MDVPAPTAAPHLGSHREQEGGGAESQAQGTDPTLPSGHVRPWQGPSVSAVSFSSMKWAQGEESLHF